MRGLSDTFIKELKSGFLKPVLDTVRSDPTLCLEIRKNYINIYYRGGNILKITQRKRKNVSFLAHFEKKYFSEATPILPQCLLNAPEDVSNWISSVPSLKHVMDIWFDLHPRKERELQQLMLRENNLVKNADYFICDIEYTQPDSEYRFDIIAIHWPSSSAKDLNNKKSGMTFIEIKQGDKALKGNSGIGKHIDKINEFLVNQDNLKDIQNEMQKIFQQKADLGLTTSQRQIEGFHSTSRNVL